jgi:hypothetical protein
VSAHDEWLVGLAAGDEVAIVSRGWGGTNVRFQLVERTTKTLVILGDGGRYRKATGRPPASDHRSDSLSRPTQKLRDHRERCDLVRKVGTVKWREVDLDTLRAVDAAIQAAAPPKGGE